MLEENLQKVETFYETQLSSFLDQFHALTLQVRPRRNLIHSRRSPKAPSYAYTGRNKVFKLTQSPTAVHRRFCSTRWSPTFLSTLAKLQNWKESWVVCRTTRQCRSECSAWTNKCIVPSHRNASSSSITLRTSKRSRKHYVLSSLLRERGECGIPIFVPQHRLACVNPR